MSPKIESANLYYHGEGWAAAMADECQLAMASIHASALSFQPPRTQTDGDWPRLYQSWVDAAARGVQVCVWLPAASTTHPATHHNLTAARRMIADGIHARLVSGNQLLHAKTCVIDASSIWIGSGNFTAAAAHFNHEAYLRADCPAIAAELIARWEALP